MIGGRALNAKTNPAGPSAFGQRAEDELGALVGRGDQVP